VGDVDEGDAGAALQRAQFGAHVLAQLQIQRRQRLVEQQHLGLHRQRAGDRHPLALAARQLARHPLAIALQRDQREQRVGLRPARLAVHPARLKPEGDVVAHAHQRKQRKGLKNHRSRPLVRAKPRHVAAADLDAALGRLQKPRDHAQDGGLAAAGGAEDREELAARNGEADAAHRAGGAESHADIDQRDGLRHGDFSIEGGRGESLTAAPRNRPETVWKPSRNCPDADLTPTRRIRRRGTGPDTRCAWRRTSPPGSATTTAGRARRRDRRRRRTPWPRRSSKPPPPPPWC